MNNSTSNTLVILGVIAHLLFGWVFTTQKAQAQGKFLNSKALEGQKTYESLEDALKEPEKVYKLNLISNKLKVLPSEIGKFANLQMLILLDNPALNFADVFTKLATMPKLQTLDLKLNKLTALPSEVGKLTNLKSLDLTFNELTVLPAEVRKLSNLQTLRLSGNPPLNITDIFTKLAALPKLQTLDLKLNKLTALPSEIGKLTNLKSLDLTFNNLTALPSEIGKLTNLKSLDLKYSQFSDKEKTRIRKLLPTCDIKF